MRKLIAFTLMILMLLGLAACAKPGENPTDPDDNGAGDDVPPEPHPLEGWSPEDDGFVLYSDSGVFEFWHPSDMYAARSSALDAYVGTGDGRDFYVRSGPEEPRIREYTAEKFGERLSSLEGYVCESVEPCEIDGKEAIRITGRTEYGEDRADDLTMKYMVNHEGNVYVLTYAQPLDEGAADIAEKIAYSFRFKTAEDLLDDDAVDGQEAEGEGEESGDGYEEGDEIEDGPAGSEGEGGDGSDGDDNLNRI